ncbi:MAG: DNA repair protein RecN [Sandaracinus sp.]|nr:DNA repair protein RecN [Sandaracinus sp.]
MLACLRVRDLAIIDALEVELGPGLNVVTGETGAGKSILVSALNLVLGARGRPELVRTGAENAEVEALFDLGDDPVLRARLEAAGIEPEENGELLVRRVVLASGRSRAYVNDRLTTASQLQTLAAGLADISSQHEHHTLTDPQTHLDYLDAFAGLAGEREVVATAHARLAEAARHLDDLRGRVRDRADREDLLRFQVQEIDELAPVVGEVEELEAERERLRHAEKLVSAAGGAEQVLYAEDGSITETLGRVAARVRQAADVDPALAGPASQLEEALTILEDAAGELGSYAREVDMNPQRLAEVEGRLDRLRRLCRKYGPRVEDVLAHRASAADELENLDQHEERILAAEKARDLALDDARTRARALSVKRKKKSKALGEAISKELGDLGMGGARVHVDLARLEGARGELEVDGARLSESGIDRCEFLIAPNTGEQARPLRKVASGGELSRALLAIKRVLTGLGPAGLYVFDEVDTGVGGAVAEVIGRKLAQVAEHHQVLCITHLAQIAVHGDAHFQVSKDVDEGRTRSTIERLSDEDRLEEIARMVGGVKITKRTRDAAAEMLQLARGR